LKKGNWPYLKTALQEILNTESQDVIELHALVVQDTNTHKTANQGVTLEETLGVLLVQGQKLTGSTTVPNHQHHSVLEKPKSQLTESWRE
jgi:hypothetical protein